MLSGQITITTVSQEVKEIFERLKRAGGRSGPVDAEIVDVESFFPGSHSAADDAAVEQVLLPALAVDRHANAEVVQIEIPGIKVEYKPGKAVPDWLEISTNIVSYHDAREAGPVHVGHQIWQKLGLPEILATAGLADKERRLAEVLTLNRLIEPTSEDATPE
jgi:hypothetical protein